MAFPFWSNTQVLWYRKSFVEKAGLDMSQPVTWDQIIDAAADNGGKIGVQANKYEGYVVWINALIAGAGGNIVEDAEKGADATITVDSAAGETAARHHREARHVRGGAGRPVGVQRGHRRFDVRLGRRTRSWSTGPTSGTTTARSGSATTSATPSIRSPSRARSRVRRTAGSASAVSDASDEKEFALEAAECLVSRRTRASTPSSPATCRRARPATTTPHWPTSTRPDLLQLFQDSVDAAAPRSVTPYWSDISSSLQSTWHPPAQRQLRHAREVQVLH